MKHYLINLIKYLIFGVKNDQNAFYREVNGYWEAYGGFKSIIHSRWMWLSILLTVALYPLWLFQNWQSIVLGIIPSLLGFSIGAMAIIFVLPSTALFKFIVWEGNSYYLELTARFVHFVLSQLVSVVITLLSYTYKFPVLDCLGFLSFIYALSICAATVFSLFGMAQIYQKQAIMEKQSNDESLTGKNYH